MVARDDIRRYIAESHCNSTRAGFRLVGRWREAHRFGGRAYDIVLMDCLAPEFTSPVLHRLVPQEE